MLFRECCFALSTQQTQPLNNGSTLATSPILPSAPKSALQPFHRKPRIWLSDICNPFPSRPSIVLSPHKPFYSPPNYSSWWLGILVVLISKNLFNRLPRCKQKQASGWDRKYLRYPDSPSPPFSAITSCPVMPISILKSKSKLLHSRKTILWTLLIMTSVSGKTMTYRRNTTHF